MPKFNPGVYAVKSLYYIASSNLTFPSHPTQGISPPRRVRISDVNDSSITLTWRSKTETISGFLIEVTPTSLPAGFIPIQRTIDPTQRSYAITGAQNQACKNNLTAKRHILNKCCIRSILVLQRGTHFFLLCCHCVFTTGLEPGTNYKINIYTLKGNGRSAPFTLTASTGNPSSLSQCNFLKKHCFFKFNRMSIITLTMNNELHFHHCIILFDNFSVFSIFI